MRVDSYSDALKRFFPGLDVRIGDDLDPASDLAKTGRVVADLYTGSVQALILHSNPVISTLGRRLWDVMNLRLAHTALTEVKSVQFLAAIKKDGDSQGVVLLPMHWAAMVSKEPIMQLGAVVYTGSQAVDYVNGRVGKDTTEQISTRAMAYEAELLKGVNRRLLNKYQRKVLGDFPIGFESRLGYTYRDVRASQA